MEMTMPAYNFQSRFVPMILDGSKPHTIRRRRKRPTKVGDVIKMFVGMRTKSCFQFGEAPCMKVEPIVIYPFEQRMLINGEFLLRKEELLIIRDDGFEVMEDFYDFFKRYKRECLDDFEIIWWEWNEMPR